MSRFMYKCALLCGFFVLISHAQFADAKGNGEGFIDEPPPGPERNVQQQPPPPPQRTKRRRKAKNPFKKWYDRERKSWFSLSIGGGVNVYKGEYYDEFGSFTDTSITHGIVGATGHLWLQKDLAIDLGIDGHFVTDYDTGDGYFHASVRPGLRLRFLYLFYATAGLDFLLGRPKNAFVFGVYMGGGIRIPVSDRLRLWAGFNVHFYPGLGFAPPVHGKLGMEVVF
ncbi:MAG: hypothetical protein CL920_35390 [Deltaproteobacteria bacterium]|nr:hypothetical protein [Deltaproteobacteria bacterium]MBU54009.1 hypothetical protein [Deltaproteobacteria bacterium]